MKKWILALLSVYFLTGLVYGQAPEAEAATGHDHHCYCTGNGGADHVCETSASWTAVTGSFTAAEGGHYYLENNIAAAITVKDGMTATLCLNGHGLRAQCPVMVYGGGTLNICDCAGGGIIRSSNPGNSNAKGSVMLISSSKSGGFGTVNLYSGTLTGTSTTAGISCRAVEVKGGVFHMYGGTITGGVSDGSLSTDAKPGYGGSVCVYTHEGHTGSFTMYDGTITGGTSAEYGGNIYGHTSSSIAILGGTVENGSSTRGGNIYCNGNVTLDGATITGGTAALYRGNVYINGTVDLSKNTVTGGTASGKSETVRLIRDGIHLVSDHISLYDAVTKLWNDAQPKTLHLQLSGNITETRTFSQDISMDLNGYTLSGITVEGKFYGMDSAGGGQLSCTLSGGQILGIGEYFPVPEGNGTYSFHSMTATVTHISVDPSKAAMGYKTQLYLADSILNRVAEFGYDMWLEGSAVRSYARPISQVGTQLTLRLNNILSPSYSQDENAINVDTPIHARPFVILDDGTKLCFSEVDFSLHDALEGADDHYNTYNQTQKSALSSLFSDYYYLIKYWHVENFHHIQSGTWTQLSSKGFLALVRQNNSTGSYTGTYVLTEDVDLGNYTVTLKEGADLTICLDGHSITGAKQLFSVQGGQLTLCDCHDGNDPGILQSTLSATTGVFAPVAQVTNNGVMNLYGGQLKGQAIVRSAGVVAVGHQTKESNATFNMYGGSISGGLADYNGGLVTVWHGSTFNMYDGALHDGHCNGDGGGLVIRDGSHANLYGGQIYGCSADNNGGGVWAQSGGSCYVGKVNIYNNTAAKKGGNVFNNGTPDFTIDGATIIDGTANEGGGVYQHTGLVRVTGTSRITRNTGSDLRLQATAQLNADGLQPGSEVMVSALFHHPMGTDPAILEYVRCQEAGYTPRMHNGQVVFWKGALMTQQTITEFSAGFGKACINPEENGLPLAGYGDAENRLSTRIDGDLYVSAVAITDARNQTVLLITVDLVSMNQENLVPYVSHISTMTGVPESNIIVSFSHTHSAPSLTDQMPAILRYKQQICDLFAQAAIDAMNDRKPASMDLGSFDVEGLNFTRHYKFQDAQGVWQYSCDNFGERNLNSQTNAQHTSDWDKTMHLVRFTRPGQRDILMVNWRAHPTLTGGPNSFTVSSDYVGALRDCFDEGQVDMIFFQGAAGNINANSRLSSEKHNLSFRKYAQELYSQINTAISGGCMQPAQPGLWQVDNHTYTATVDHTDDERTEEAEAFVEAYYDAFPGNQGEQADRLAWCAERGWTCVFEASSIIRRAGMGQTAQMHLNTLALGQSLAFFTAPGELFDTVSLEVEAASQFDMTFCLGYSMGNHKYFLYDPNNGGNLTYDSYEGFNRNYLTPDTILDMLAYWKQALNTLYSQE